MISIEDLRKMVQEVPPLPEVVLRLLNMCNDPDVAPRDIIEVIKHDPAVTMKVLRLCNSPSTVCRARSVFWKRPWCISGRTPS